MTDIKTAALIDAIADADRLPIGDVSADGWKPATAAQVLGYVAGGLPPAGSENAGLLPALSTLSTFNANNTGLLVIGPDGDEIGMADPDHYATSEALAAVSATIPYVAATGLASAASSNTTVAEANRLAVISQWNAAANAGKALMIDSPTPVTYRFTFIDQLFPGVSQTFRGGVRPGDPTKRYVLYLGPNVTLEVADNQFTGNSTRGGLICYTNMAAGVVVDWPFGARGGTFSGNSAGNPGTNWSQAEGYHGMLGIDTVAGGGSKGVYVGNVRFYDFKSHGHEHLGGVTANGQIPAYHDARTTGTKDIWHVRTIFERCGQHKQIANAHRCRAINTRYIAVSGIQEGDGAEYASCYDVVMVNPDADLGDGANPTPMTNAGSALDFVASKKVRVYGGRVFGWHSAVQAITGQTEGGQTVKADDIVVRDLHLESINTPVLTPAEGGGVIRYINPTLVDCPRPGGSGSSILEFGYGGAGGEMHVVGLVGRNCKGAVVSASTGGLLRCRDWDITGQGAGSYFFTFFGNLVDLDVADVTARGFESGILSNYGYTPKGKFFADVSGCTRPKTVIGGASLHLLECELIGESVAPYRVGSYNLAPAYVNTVDEYPIQGYRWGRGLLAGASVGTLPAGSKNQTHTILVPSGETQTLVHGTGNIYLLGGQTVSLIGPTSLTLRYDTSAWVQTAGYAPPFSWEPDYPAGLLATVLVAECRKQGKLWQDAAKTVPATADGHPVRVATCPYTLLDWTAPADASRPLLTSLGQGRWGLAFDGSNDELTAPTGATLSGASTLAARYAQTASASGTRVLSSASVNALLSPRRQGGNTVFSGGSARRGDPWADDAGYHTLVFKKGAQWELRSDGASVSLLSADATDWGRPTLGLAGETFTGVITAGLVYGANLTGVDLTSLESYLGAL